MAYNRNYSNGYGRRSSGYGRQYQQPQPRKRSGASSKVCTNEKNGDSVMIVSAWRVNRKGELLVLYARPYQGTSVHQKSRGEFLNYFVTIVNKQNYSVVKTSGLLYEQSRRLLLPEFGEIVTDRGRGGVWCSVRRK